MFLLLIKPYLRSSISKEESHRRAFSKVKSPLQCKMLQNKGADSISTYFVIYHSMRNVVRKWMLLSIRWQAHSWDRGVYQNTKKQERQVLFWRRPIIIYQRQNKYFFYDYIVVIRLSNDKRIVLYQLSDQNIINLKFRMGHLSHQRPASHYLWSMYPVILFYNTLHWIH